MSSGIGSALNLSKYLSQMYDATPRTYSIIYGLMLGDSWTSIGKDRNINARLGFKQSFPGHFPFLFLVFLELQPYCRSLPGLVSKVLRGKRFHALQIQTRAFPFLTLIHNNFYVGGLKIIPDNFLNDISPLAIAYWVMCDGYRVGNGLAICTDSFTIVDQNRILSVLSSKYGLNGWLFKHSSASPDPKCISPIIIHYRIRFSSSDMYLIRRLLVPHMHASMLYKLGLQH